MKSINSQDVSFYTPLINDYLKGELKNKNIVSWDYSESQIFENVKKRSFSPDQRDKLVSTLKQQYGSVELTTEEKTSLQLLEAENTFTITTGHQLSLIGGPQFFYTKILDVINLCKHLSGHEEYNFVPVFWMATEDHDYEEISSVNLFGKKISCPGENKGPVGRIDSAYFNSFLEEINSVLGDGEAFRKVKSMINEAFKNGTTLAEITRIFVRGLFADQGLLIIDGDDVLLKQQMKSIFLKELMEKSTFEKVGQQVDHLNGYKIQVSPREINLFYIEKDLRERIVENESGFQTVDGSYKWTNTELEELVENSPEKISPNVLLRPLYQEVVLPNVAYMGGAGEISYWLELESMFKEFEIDFPLPIVRTSYFIAPKKTMDWLDSIDVKFKDLFGNTDQLQNEVAKRISTVEINFSSEINQLKLMYEGLLSKAKSIDSNLNKVVLGEEKRALGALQNVEKRFVNAEKKKHEQTLNKLKSSINKLFPNGSPMERVDSFIPLLAKESFQFQSTLNPFEGDIVLLTI